jgi:hypothetical protein
MRPTEEYQLIGEIKILAQELFVLAAQARTHYPDSLCVSQIYDAVKSADDKLRYLES